MTEMVRAARPAGSKEANDMRLICPNCGATYEVAADAIPEPGRDVQCSNCAHTWFETPGASEARERGEEPEVVSQPEPMPDDEANTEEVTEQPAGDPPQPAEPEPTAQEDPHPEEEETSADGDPADDRPSQEIDEVVAEDAAPEAEVETAARTTVKPSVADILREEAAREEARRAEDAQSQLQSQPDLDLDRPVDRDEQLAEEARRRMARLRGEAAPAIGAATAAGAKGELLPDIEEINSSLRSNQTAEDPEPSPASPANSGDKGFRRGFLTVITLAILALIVYLMAPRLTVWVPALERPLTTYVGLVDQVRLWLDLTLQGLLSGGGSEN